MPELVNSRVGSLPGTSGADGTIVCPLPLKNSRKSLRMRAVVYGVVGVIWLRWRTGPGRECAARARRDGNSTCKGYQSMAAGRRNRDQGLARRPGSRPPASSVVGIPAGGSADRVAVRSEEHTSELQSRENLVCRLLLEKTKSAFLSKSPTL